MSRRCANWLRTYMQYTSLSEAPELFHFAIALTTLAGAVRRRVWFDQYYWTWIPNLYTILVAPPGIATKTTTLDTGMSLLREVPGVQFGSDVITWQALIQEMAEAKQAVPVPGSCPPGGDELLDRSYDVSCSLIYASGELGNLLDPKDRQEIDALINLWDGRTAPFKKRTKGSGSDEIEKPCINIAACVTPAWLRENFPRSAVLGGFTSRCLFCYSESKRQLVAFPKDLITQIGLAEWTALRQDLIMDLIQISELYGEFTLATDAKAWAVEWYRKHWTSKDQSPQYSGYWARKQTFLFKLAMLYSVAKRDDLIISMEDILEAHSTLELIEEQMMYVFRNIGISDEARALDDVLAIVRPRHTISETELMAELTNYMSHKTLRDALNTGVMAGMLRMHTIGSALQITYIGKDQVDPAPATIVQLEDKLFGRPE